MKNNYRDHLGDTGEMDNSTYTVAFTTSSRTGKRETRKINITVESHAGKVKIKIKGC